LRYDDLALFTFADSIQGVRYLVGRYFNLKDGGYRMRIKKVELQNSHLIASVQTNESIDSRLAAVLITSHTLKGVQAIVKVMAFDDYCGGSERATYIADAGKRLVLLPSDYYSMDDGGGVDTKVLYLPHMRTDNSVVLQNDTSGNSGTLPDTLTVPAAIHYTPDEIVAIQHTSGAYAMDDNNDYIKTKNGFYKMAYPIISTAYFYHWNGKTLTRLPSTRIKRAPPEKWKEQAIRDNNNKDAVPMQNAGNEGL
jgi:hypothetical protein